tara:strand:+ start:95 stop:481 length:387 start_codon:yes stop_codon:yes gene_type:complete
MSNFYSIAELAREFRVTTRTIRFYEDKELLAPARQGQRRVYSPRDRVRLRLIMRGKRLGFSLSEIRQMINLYDVDPSEVSQLKLFLEKIRERKAMLGQQQKDIETILEELDKLETESIKLLEEKRMAE